MQNEKISIIHINKLSIEVLRNRDKIQIARSGIFMCFRGSTTAMIDNETYEIKPNSIVVYFPNGVIDIETYTDDIEGVILSANIETIQPLLHKIQDFNRFFLIRKSPYTIPNKSQWNTMIHHLNILVEKLKETEEEDKNNIFNNTENEINKQQIEMVSNSMMLEIVSCYNHLTTQSEPTSRKEEVLQTFLSNLNRFYRKEHEVRYYAGLQFLTCRYFSAIIKEESGKTPSQWIASALMSDSKHLLKNTNEAIKQISDLLNFPNQSYFGKWFKNLTGISPLDYRNGKPVKITDDSIIDGIIRKSLEHK